MSKEYFWGDSLSSSKKEIKWNPSLDDEDYEEDTLDLDGIQHFLFIKQAVLGVNAKDDERNVVEIETENFDGDDVKQPLFSLKLGLNESSLLDIAVQPPVTFTLVAGSGPVYINGQHMIEINADDDDDDDLEEEEEEEEGEEDVEVKASPDLPVTKSKKRPLSTSESTAKKIKMSKLDKEEEEEEEDEEMAEMDDDDDEDEDIGVGGEEDNEEDSDEEDEDEDEEDEESPEKPLVKVVKGKKGKVNGTTAKGDGKSKTKTATNSVTFIQTGLNEAVGSSEETEWLWAALRRQSAKGKGKKKALALDDIKKKVQESSGVPKKEDKFKNYIRSSFHMTDTKKLQDLWGWYRTLAQK